MSWNDANAGADMTLSQGEPHSADVDDDGGDAGNEEMANDAEGVWSPDIEQSFQEALAIYPPCGRRKIILSDEGKMYGRNELIARYIKLRTGKTRSRKQVSSHIQVLAKRKMKEMSTHVKVRCVDGTMHENSKDKVLQSMAAMSSAQIVSAGALNKSALTPTVPTYGPYSSQFWGQDTKPVYGSPGYLPDKMISEVTPTWQGRSIAGPRLRMVEFSAFMEHGAETENYHKHLFVHIDSSQLTYSDPHLEAVGIGQIYDKFPEKKGGLKELYERGPHSCFFLVKCWADLDNSMQDETGASYLVSSVYEGSDNITITVSTKVCSFGKQVVEKVETEYPRFEGNHFVYTINRSAMCEYMINFVHKLKHLPEKYMMNSVLENFTILQVVTNRDTHETLLCVAYVFEVSNSVHGSQHHIYRLIKDCA